MDMIIRMKSSCIINRATTKYFAVLLIGMFSPEEITGAWSYSPKLCWLKMSTVSNEVYFVFVLCYSYRSRDEVQSVRKTRDPISGLREKLLDSGLADVDDIKVKRLCHPVYSKPLSLTKKLNLKLRVLRRNPSENWVILIFSGPKPCTRII